MIYIYIFTYGRRGWKAEKIKKIRGKEERTSSRETFLKAGVSPFRLQRTRSLKMLLKFGFLAKANVQKCSRVSVKTVFLREYFHEQRFTAEEMKSPPRAWKSLINYSDA